MRPSMPMSPTCALLGMPPRAMTAQFSNSNGGMSRSCFFRPRQIAHHEASCRVARVFIFAQLAHIAQPLRHHAAGGRGDIDSDPLTVRFCAATSAVPQPQNASSTMSLGLLLKP